VKLSLKDLTHRYPSGQGIFSVNLEITGEDNIAIIGPSGSGKSTLLNCIAGFLPPQKGTLEFSGFPSQPPRIGLLQQQDALFPWLTIRDSIALSEELDPDFWIRQLGLEGHEEKYPHQLSGGQRQRVALGRTLAYKPDMLLMDEPTASLDAFTKEKLQDLLLNLHIQAPLPRILVTHDIEEALFLGKTILFMNQGRIYHRYKNPFFPDPAGREHRAFYQEVVNLRKILQEVF